MKSVQFLATLTSSLAILSSGIHEAWTSVYIPKLLNGTEIVTITSEEGSWITLTMSIGGLFGCLLACLLTDKIGRKKTILLTFPPNFFASLLLANSKSVLVFCAARLLSGLAFGMAIAVIPHYLGEIADPEVRGTFGTIVSIFSLIGLLSINVLGTFVSITVSSLITAIIPIVFLLTFFWMPESPYYLIKIGEFDRAEKYLARLKGKDDVCDEFNKLKESVALQIKEKAKTTDLFTKRSNRKALFIVFILVNGKQLTGIGPIDAYAQLIFQQLFKNVSPLFVTFFYYITRLFMVVLSSFFTHKIGRRSLLIISFFGCFLSLLLLALYLHFQKTVLVNATTLPFLFIEGFAIFYSFLTPIPLSVLGELFAMNVKIFASIFYEVFLYVITFVVIKCFQELSDNFGMETPFFAFAISCLVHLILIYRYVFETTGKTLDEIQDCLEK